MKIVIARYNEDISWISQLNTTNIIIYNKGQSLGISNEIMIENVGKEGHTFYKYIYDNYDELDEYTVFLQGNPFDHLPNTINIINELIQNNSMKFIALSKKLLKCNTTACIYHSDLPLRKTYEYLFNKNQYVNFLFGPGGQFMVHKNEILKHPKEFYLKIVNLLSYTVNPIEGYVIERFHPLIFNHYVFLKSKLQKIPLYF